MKTHLAILLASLVLTLAAEAQYHHHGHGHYYHSEPVYTPPAYTPPVYTPPTPAAPPAPRQPTQADRDAARQRAAEQQRATAQAARQREEQRQEQRRQATFDALDQIARESGQNFTPAQRPAQDLGSHLERIAQENAARRQQGYDCIVSQSGGMNCYQQLNMNAPASFNGQQVLRVPEAFSGSLSGGGYNNPALQHVRNNGPIPQGAWNATGVRDTLREAYHPDVIVLDSAPGNDRAGRDNDFLIHGDNRQRPGDGSNGCVIAPRDVRSTLRDMLNSGGQVRLNVTP